MFLRCGFGAGAVAEDMAVATGGKDSGALRKEPMRPCPPDAEGRHRRQRAGPAYPTPGAG
ncbi:hypothetical protein GCM10009416_44760 [Craurococcus roseus]|uniref:Uncharacterized protein n=1 Tax=Craurococcus roseus TaxID=77585 RepID=A0ABP3R1S4_9PROT